MSKDNQADRPDDKTFLITVNGRQRRVEDEELSFDDLVDLAFEDPACAETNRHVQHTVIQLFWYVIHEFRSPCSGLAERASSPATARPMIITDRREHDDDLMAAPIAARGSLRNA